MYILPLQWDRGTSNSIGDRKLIFSADKSIDLQGFNPFEIEQGTQFMVIMVPVNSEEMNDFKTETAKETLDRFKRHMEVLIGDVARLLKKDQGEYREQFKAFLTEKGYIQKSTSELDLNGYANAIVYLKNKRFELTKQNA